MATSDTQAEAGSSARPGSRDIAALLARVLLVALFLLSGVRAQPMRAGVAFLLAAAFVLSCAEAEPMAPQPSDPLVELVRPIALYPDPLVAQVLAASTHPDELAQAQAWRRQHAGMNPQELIEAVDAQPWDPGVKALTQFPALLADMARNASWTGTLGEAYKAAPAEVVSAIQTLRRRAQADGTLESMGAQRVVDDRGYLLIGPNDLRRVAVPGGGAYDIVAEERFTWSWLGWDLDWRRGTITCEELQYP